MNCYGITFKECGKTITMDAEFFDIKDGFLRLFDSRHGVLEHFAIYDAGNILHCVEQQEFTPEEIETQIIASKQLNNNGE